MLSCKVGEKTVNTIDNIDSDIRTWSKKGILKCPVCGAKMLYKNGKIKIAHFAHDINSKWSLKYREKETEEHLKGKKALYEWLKTQDVENLELESWIPETKQRPDVYFEYKGKRYVIEYQCTPISSEHIERHQLYEMAGIEDIWILGTEKYDINNIGNVVADNVNVYLKVKAIEDILISQQKLYYLKDNNLIFCKKAKRFEHYKTKFKYTIDVYEKFDNIDIDDFIGFKLNIIDDSLDIIENKVVEYNRIKGKNIGVEKRLNNENDCVYSVFTHSKIYNCESRTSNKYYKETNTIPRFITEYLDSEIDKEIIKKELIENKKILFSDVLKQISKEYENVNYSVFFQYEKFYLHREIKNYRIENIFLCDNRTDITEDFLLCILKKQELDLRNIFSKKQEEELLNNHKNSEIFKLAEKMCICLNENMYRKEIRDYRYIAYISKENEKFLMVIKKGCKLLIEKEIISVEIDCLKDIFITELKIIKDENLRYNYICRHMKTHFKNDEYKRFRMISHKTFSINNIIFEIDIYNNFLKTNIKGSFKFETLDEIEKIIKKIL